MAAQSKLILFPDLDGVLATRKSYVQFDNKLDPTCIATLNILLEQVSCEIVITSTWKRLLTIELLKSVLKDVNAPIIDVTPNAEIRWQEINAWLQANSPIHQFLSVDDQSTELAPFLETDHLVLIQRGFDQGGIQRPHIREAFTKLKKQVQLDLT